MKKNLFALLVLLIFSTFAQARPDDVPPAETLKQLDFDASIKPAAFTTPLEGSRLKDATGNVMQVTQEKMSETIAKKILKNKFVQLKLLFAPQAAAYPGMLTKDQSCKDSAAFGRGVQTKADSIFWFSEMPGSEDFGYGACGSRAEPYWSQYLLIYCKKQQVLYDIRYFKLSTKKEGEKINHPIAKCKN